jgi:hypothetical protein
MPPQPVYPFVIGVILIVGEVVLQNQQQEDAYGNAQGQPQNIEDGKEFVLQKYSGEEL